MIRKTAPFFALLLFFVLPASAQVPGLGGIGIKGGATFAKINFENDDAYTYQTDFVAGIYGQIPVSDYVTIQPELLYARKGASFDDVQGQSVDAKLNLDYVEVPVLFKVNLPVENTFFPNLFAGPYASYALTRSYTGDDADALESLSGNPEDLFKQTDYGVALGAEFDLTVADVGFTLGGRYDLGLANIADGEGSEEVDVNTSTFMVTLGFSL